jgi:propanediol dehydratase large subunit
MGQYWLSVAALVDSAMRRVAAENMIATSLTLRCGTGAWRAPSLTLRCAETVLTQL